jgi:hypothetical protein
VILFVATSLFDGSHGKIFWKRLTNLSTAQFHAYFPTANSYPAIVADILSGAIACIGFSWIGGQ